MIDWCAGGPIMPIIKIPILSEFFSIKYYLRGAVGLKSARIVSSENAPKKYNIMK